ncbi:MAG: penicillin-binding protein activator [Solirubrobacterales bacterium]
MGGTKPTAEAPRAPQPRVQAPPRPVPPVAAVPPQPQPPLPPQPQIQIQTLPPAPAPLATDKGGEVRAALLVPLSGQYASWGTALSNAAQLAMFEIADQRFNLIPLDTHGTAEGAAAAAQQAVAQGADIVLGPLFSPEVKAAAPVARDQAVPMLAFTTDRAAAGGGVYAMGILPGPQVERVVSFARTQGKNRFALLAPNSEYGRTVADALKAAVAANGAQLAKIEYYDPNAQDHSAVVRRFTDYDSRTRGRAKGSTDPVPPPPFDAVLLPDSGTRLRTISALLTYYEVDPSEVKLLGTLLWDDPRLANEPALNGGWYAAPPTADHQAFETRYGKAFGPLPSQQVGNVASLAYDATALAAKLAHGGQADYSAAALTNPNGFAGVDGIFRLMPDGQAQRGLAVREIVRGGSREVSPAPAVFPAIMGATAPGVEARVTPAAVPSGR